MISDEHLRPGDQLPAEALLATQFGVSRSKVREALKLLEQDGTLRAIQGKGRFVSALGALRVERPITVYESITEMLASRGDEVTTVVLEVQETGCDERAAGALDLVAGDPIILLTRLRMVDEEPMVFSINAVPRRRLPGPIEFRDWSSSLTEALRAHGHGVASSAARVSATNLDRGLAERYSLSRFDPWLLVEESCIADSGERVLHALDYHRGDAVSFNVLRRR
jgi:GntR family transcriptional regulator